MPSPGEGRYGDEPEQELEAVEAEQHGVEQELEAQDEGLQQKVVHGERGAGKQDKERHTGSQRALAQVSLPAWMETQFDTQFVTCMLCVCVRHVLVKHFVVRHINV